MFQLDVLRSQRSVLRGKLLSGRRVGHNDTFPSHRKINLPRRTKSKPVTIAPPEQLRHRDGEESPLHQARWCTTSAQIGFHHFVLAAEFLQLDLFGEFPLPRRSGTHLSEDDNQFV